MAPIGYICTLVRLIVDFYNLVDINFSANIFLLAVFKKIILIKNSSEISQQSMLHFSIQKAFF